MDAAGCYDVAHLLTATHTVGLRRVGIARAGIGRGVQVYPRGGRAAPERGAVVRRVGPADLLAAGYAEGTRRPRPGGVQSTHEAAVPLHRAARGKPAG